MTVDIDRIKSDYRVSEVVGRFVALRKSGSEHKGLCPFHADSDPSLAVIDHKRIWTCPVCDITGDIFDFVMQHQGVTLPAAAEIITGQRQASGPAYTPPAKADDVPETNMRAIMPVPDDAPPLHVAPDKVRFRRLRKDGNPWVERTITDSFDYRDSEGRLLGYVIRMEFERDGKRQKLTPTITYCEFENGDRAWVDRSFPEPRPLCGLDDLAAFPAKVVLVVEGEKSRKALKRMLPDSPVITWPNGTNSVEKAEWSALKGRKVVFWPDADSQNWPASHPEAGTLKPLHEQPGTKAMMKACEIIEGFAAGLVLEPPADKIKGWDAADAEIEWGAEKTRQWIADAIRAANAKRIVPPPAEREESPASDAEHDGMPAYDGQGYDGAPAYDDAPYSPPFRVLGHDRGVFFYLPKGSRQVVELTASSHTKLNLYQLAAPSYWESTFPAKSGADYDQAAAVLISQCYKAGVFNPTRKRRGRGAWIDHGRNVYHLGDRLWVNGDEIEIDEFETGFVYEQADAMDIDLSRPLNTQAANSLLDIARQFRWGSELHAYLIAGWCVIAPVCGILAWRPHIWITGPSGSGKSTIVRDFVSVLLSATAYVVEGATTEAGIRQDLDGDARPVVFDEAEPKDQNSLAKIRAVLDLARVSSSESGGTISKGGNNHKSKSFRVRSCFCFASINPAVEFYADETRITKLQLSRPRRAISDEERAEQQARWEALEGQIASTITREYAEGLIARTVRNLETLRENARIFARAAGTYFGSARHGQQYGPMLAGAYLLHSTGRISYEAALEWMRKHNFKEVAESSEGDSDEVRCISHLLQSRIRATIEQGRAEDYSVAELISYVSDAGDDYAIAEKATDYLCRIGIKPDSGGIWVSNTHSALKQIFAGTPWAAGWRETLLGAPGAEKSKNAIYFQRFTSTRAVWLPQEVLR